MVLSTSHNTDYLFHLVALQICFGSQTETRGYGMWLASLFFMAFKTLKDPPFDSPLSTVVCAMLASTVLLPSG
jgi:hypothetical protein